MPRLYRAFLSVRLWVLLVLAFLVLVRIWDPVPLQILRIKSFDLYQLLNDDRPANAVKVIDIDEKSLAALGQWPWPRTLVSRLSDTIFEQGAVAVGVDIVFAEHDRTSPEQFTAQRKDLPDQIRTYLQSLKTNDDLLKAALETNRVVLGSAVLAEPGKSNTAKAKSTYATLGENPGPFVLNAPGRVANLQALERAASGIGIITNHPEIDGIVRRVPALFRIKDQLFPPMALEVLRVATGQMTYVVKTGADGVHSVVLAGVEIPTDAQGRIWVKFRKRDPSRYYSAVDALNGKLPANALRGRLVLIGTSAAGLLDLKSTPLDRVTPGVDVHAQLLENILARDFIARPSYAISLEVGATIVVGLAFIILLPRFGGVFSLMLGGVIAATTSAAAVYFYKADGLLFDISFFIAASLSVYLILVISNYLKEERSRRNVREAFGRYVSPTIVERLTEHSEELMLGGQHRELTILFCDIRSFTSLSQKLGAESTASFMNSYLTRMTDIILRNEGTIDKFIGDAIMAFWNAPLNDERHVAHALSSALGMIDALSSFNVDMAGASDENIKKVLPIRIGIGLNTGDCLVGNFGSIQRFDYSAIGDNVNVAARLEELTKSYKIPILVSQNTVDMAPDFAFLAVDKVTIRGRSDESEIFALVGDPEYRATSKFADLASQHAEFMERRAGGDDESVRAAAKECASDCPDFLRGYYAQFAEMSRVA